MSFEIIDIWAESLWFSLSPSESRGHSPIVVINGQQIDAQSVARMGRNVWAVDFDFSRTLVRSFEVRNGPEVIPEAKGGMVEVLFKHDLEATREKVQRRGALKLGKGVQLVASYQSYLWARHEEFSPELSLSDRIRFMASSICSVTYRYMQTPKSVSDEVLAQLRALGGYVISLIDNSTPDARWYPSVQLALGQLFLLSNHIDEALGFFLDISDKQEQILHSEPICAFNISLANCLATFLLAERRDPRLSTYEDRWQFVFRHYPPKMDIRFGTMQEFGKIYDATFLNYRIALRRDGVKDPRFVAATFEEVMNTCIRVNLSKNRVRQLESQLFPSRKVPKKVRRQRQGSRRKLSHARRALSWLRRHIGV